MIRCQGGDPKVLPLPSFARCPPDKFAEQVVEALLGNLRRELLEVLRLRVLEGHELPGGTHEDDALAQFFGAARGEGTLDDTFTA